MNIDSPHIQEFSESPNRLAHHYSKSQVNKRLLFTGHSHQAWPDCAYDGMIEYHNDAALLLDDKWGKAFEKTEIVKSSYRKLLGDSNGHISLIQNTHEAVVRFISGLDLINRPKLITTDGEFHTMRRQFDRLAEENWLVLARVNAVPMELVKERIINHIDDKTSAVFVSTVFFKNSLILDGIKDIYDKCQLYGAELMLDAYHQLNVVPFSIDELNIPEVYVTGGGYKYMQFGEGNCFIRIPQSSKMRPIYTGWFSEFGELHKAKGNHYVDYGKGDLLFAGSTYDPISQYRAAAVSNFFTEQKLEVELLRAINLHQINFMRQLFDSFDFPSKLLSRETKYANHQFGGFFVINSPIADELQKRLFKNGVLTDSRGSHLRFGPAPYISDDQIRQAFSILNDIVKAFK